MGKKISDAIYSPQFLKFTEHYAEKFRANQGFGKWLKEYQDMEAKKQFAPKVLRLFYIQMLSSTSKLDFQKRQAVWYICIKAQDATEACLDDENAKYEIRVFTGELAYDDDEDPYTDLTYDEATQIVKSLNEEEELFIVKRI